MVVIALKLFIVLLLVLANGFFVAAEFALVSVRRARIEMLAAAGKSSAKAVLRALDHLDTILSATQFGVTLASLALGAVGESTLEHMVEGFFVAYLPGFAAVPAAHTFSAVIAFSVITYFHIVLGEFAPKALALEKAEMIAMAVTPPIQLFYRVFKPFIWVINRSGMKLLRIFGLEARLGHHAAITGEELKHLITMSHESGNLQLGEKTLIHNVFDFGDLTVREILIPRMQISAIEADASFVDVVKAFQSSGYSRLPVYDDNFDHIIGILHHKDVMAHILNPQAFDLRKVIIPPVFIPDTARLADVLEQMRRGHVHLAIVVDEHSGVEGILTLEDLLEEIVGEIQDEHDEAGTEKFRERGAGVFVIDGGLSMREVNRRFDLNLPESDDYATIAGFLIAREGRLLAEGDTLNYNGTSFTVERVNQRRITRISMRQTTEAPPPVLDKSETMVISE